MTLTPRNGAASDLIAALPGAMQVAHGVRIACRQEAKLATLAKIAALESKIADLDVVPPSLEDIYSHFSRRDGQ